MLPSVLGSPAPNMSHSVLGTSMAVNDSVSAQGIETATQFVNKQMNYDSSFPSLYEMLEVPGEGCASVSGLNEKDYPSGGDGRVQRHLHTLKKVPLPADLLHHFQHMQCNCMMGLFPEIRRAWLTIDSDIYVWMYEDGSDLAYFDGLHDTILSVGLVKPKQGVFKPYIEYLLCLTTPTEIVLLGVSFSHSEESSTSMHLLPEPLFSVATDGAYILTIKGTLDGRIFYGTKDGSLWELAYQAEDGWFSRKCQKVNHSKSLVTYILPSFLTLSEDDPVCQIEVDDSRHIIYTLTEKGNIGVFDLGVDGKSMAKVMSLNHSTIVNMASQVAKTIDKANFKTIVGICPIDSMESHQVHLVVITGTGVRLYYRTTPLNNPLGRPCQMTLLHIRLPPGYAANALTHRPTRVHKCQYSHGRAILCASESTESDVIWTVSRDQYPYHPSLTESQAVLAIDGFVWALADVTPPHWKSALNPLTAHGTQPPLLVTQHQQPPRQLVLLSASGAHVLTTLRPVDQLKQLLQESGNVDSSAIKDFFQTMSPIQACATAFILCMDPNLQESQVGEMAKEAIFRYGCTLPAPSFPNGFQTPQNPQYSFQPSQMSTPFGAASPAPTNIQNDQQFSPLHNALYLYLARILRPVWNSPLVKEHNTNGNVSFVPLLSTDEVSFLARRVEFMAKFMTANQGPTKKQSNMSNTTIAGFASFGSVNERSSLLSLRALLGQCLEVLRLWAILNTHNFTLIADSLTKEIKDQLRVLSLQDLILSGKDMSRHLIMALMNRYHGDNTSIDAISLRLRDVCPSLFKLEDAKLSKANEVILLAKNCNGRQEKEQLFRKSVELCKDIGHAISVGGICNQLASGGWYEGIVDLCLSVAAQRDPNGQGLHYYKNNEPSDDPQGYTYFTSRVECYRVMMEHIYQLVGTSGAPSPVAAIVPARPGPPSPPEQSLPASDAGQFAEQMISLIVSSADELAHVTLYQWLLDTGRTERLLSIGSPFIETFFVKSDVAGPMNDFLWKYYERNKEYFKAAKTLYLLTNQANKTCLTERVEYLCRALMCLSASQINTATSYADFMLHLEEKKDVAKLQLMILKAVEGKGGSREIMDSLNSELLDITTLYEKYAEPFQLWECKLSVVHCAGHYEPQLIQSLWTHIIDEELNQRLSTPLSVRIDSLSAKLESLAYVYSTSPNYFPLEHIIKTCELASVKLRVENTTWVVSALQNCGIPIGKLISIYHRLYSVGDSIWEVERSPYHLLKILAYLFGLLTDNYMTMVTQEKRALTEQCLDYIAAYLTDLGSSADPTAAIVSSHLRTCQVKLEKN